MPPTIQASSTRAILSACTVLALLCATALPDKTEAAVTLLKPSNNLGLVGYWSFNEGTGTIASDFSGNGTHGTIIGDPTWVSGKRGNALQLDEFKYVNVSTLTIAPTAFTVSYWLFPTSCIDFNQHVSSFEGWDAFVIHADSNCAMFAGTSVATRFTPTELPAGTFTLNQWQHFTYTYDGTQGRFYKNGLLIAGPQAQDPPIPWGGFAIGNDSEDSIVGKVDEVRVYNRALAPSEVAKLHQSGAVKIGASSVELQRGSTLANDLVGHWTFDGPDVTTVVADRSGQNNHGYFNGGATSSAKVAGKLGQALSFNGTNNIRISGLLGNPAAVTLSAWVNLTTPDADGAEVVSLGDNVSIRADHPSLGTMAFYYHGGGWHITSTNTNIAGTGWHHVVYVTDPANSLQRVYIDGVLSGENSHTDAIVYAGNGSNTNIATHGNGVVDNDFIGKLDDIRVYTRALSPTEVKQLYQLGTVRITQ